MEDTGILDLDLDTSRPTEPASEHDMGILVMLLRTLTGPFTGLFTVYPDNSATLDVLNTPTRSATAEGPKTGFTSSEPSTIAPQLLLPLIPFQKFLTAWKDELDAELGIGILEAAALDGLLETRSKTAVTSPWG